MRNGYLDFDYYLELIEKTKVKLIEQGVRSAYKTAGKLEYCCYRLDKTADCETKCAVGHHILDEFYNPEFEDDTVFSISVQEALKLSGIPIHDQIVIAILDKCQSVHDTSEPEDWEYLFEKLAFLVESLKQAEEAKPNSVSKTLFKAKLHEWYSHWITQETLDDFDFSPCLKGKRPLEALQK